MNDETRTYAERLGWERGSVVAIVHVDDAGMSHGSNVGTMETLNSGLATSFSMMMPCAWVPEMVEMMDAKAARDVGVHVTLNSEMNGYRWGPVAGAAQVPGLVDGDGCLWRTVPELVKSASADEVEKEIRAQLGRAEAMGLEVTHLDTHMGAIFGHPDYFGRYVRVGIEKRIPLLVTAGHSSHAVDSHGEEVRKLTQFSDALWGAGLPLLDDIHASSLGWSPETKKERYIDLFQQLQPGITQIIVHPTRMTEDLAIVSSSGPSRAADLEVLLDPQLMTVVEDRGIILTTWRELMERRAAAG